MAELRRIDYAALNARQKENYNFHKVAAQLADFGFNSMRLTDDWEGADFIACHVNGRDFLRVQLKSRPVISRKYEGRGIHIAFLDGDRCYVYPHDAVSHAIEARGDLAGTISWDEMGHYTWSRIPSWLREILAPFELASQ